VSEGNAHGHDDTDLRLRSCTQITLFGVASGGHLGNQIAEHIGGYCATAAASDHHVARPTVQSASERTEYLLLQPRHLYSGDECRSPRSASG
jgi:hypothetical protein